MSVTATIISINPYPRFKKSYTRLQQFLQVYSESRVDNLYTSNGRFRLAGSFRGTNISIYLSCAEQIYYLKIGIAFKATSTTTAYFNYCDPENKRHTKFLFRDKEFIRLNLAHLSSRSLVRLLNIMDTEVPRFQYGSSKMTEVECAIEAMFGPNLIKGSEYTTSSPMIKPRDVSASLDGQMVMEAILQLENRLKPLFKNIMREYYHPMIFSTYYREKGNMHTPPNDFSPATFNPNLFGSLNFLSERYTHVAPNLAAEMPLHEKITFIDTILRNTPVDEDGWPIDMLPPDMEHEDLCANGPKATSGGVTIQGKKALKTTIYYSCVEFTNNMVRSVDYMQRENQKLSAKSRKRIKMPIMDLMMSPKSEIIKKDKKMRFFTVVQSPVNLIETVVLGPIINATKSTPLSMQGGRRIMNGATLENGYGTYMFYSMLSRGGHDPQTVRDDLRENKKNSQYFKDMKAFVGDYSSFEFQHHVVQAMMAYLPYWVFYNFQDHQNTAAQFFMAYLTEVHTQVDLDIGKGRKIQFPPAALGSGVFTTLDGNGHKNLINLKLAANEIIFSGNVSDEIKREAFLISRDMAVQGDDCYYVSPRPHTAEAFSLLVKRLEQRYHNKIKTDCRPAFALMDENGFDTNHAGDFLKLKPFFMNNGEFYFMRASEESLQRILIPNSPEFSVVTQYYASISQMIINAGNKPMYDLAKKKMEVMAQLMSSNNMDITSIDREAVVEELAKKVDIKNSKLIDYVMNEGFRDMEYGQIVRKFLMYDETTVQNMARNVECYVKHAMSYDALRNYSRSSFENFD
jgi:hypothetical protein